MTSPVSRLARNNNSTLPVAGSWGMFLDEATIDPAQPDTAIGAPLDAEPTFVYQPVVMAAHRRNGDGYSPGIGICRRWHYGRD